MAEGNSYVTTSRKKILAFLQKNRGRTVTVADIDFHLKELDSEVNPTTIYRYMDKLVNDGTVMKYVAEKGGQTTYQYAQQGQRCREHLHLKCIKCGHVLHLDCAFMKEISEHILQDHGFELQCGSSMLYGLCLECRKFEEGAE